MVDHVTPMLTAASAVASLTDVMSRHLAASSKVAAAIDAAGIPGHEAMAGTSTFYAYMFVVAELGGVDGAKPLEGSGKERYLQTCSTIYDMMTLYQRGMLENAAQTKKEDKA